MFARTTLRFTLAVCRSFRLALSRTGSLPVEGWPLESSPLAAFPLGSSHSAGLAWEFLPSADCPRGFWPLQELPFAGALWGDWPLAMRLFAPWQSAAMPTLGVASRFAATQPAGDK